MLMKHCSFKWQLTIVLLTCVTKNYSQTIIAELCVLARKKKKYLIELKITGQDKHQNLVIQLLFTTY